MLAVKDTPTSHHMHGLHIWKIKEETVIWDREASLENRIITENCF